MPQINPTLVPTIPPGDLFQALTANNSLNIRWLTALDPVFYAVLNRPLADITFRELIMAKAIDQLNASLGHQATFPFIIQPQISSGSGLADVPLSLFWDLNISVPSKWQKLRLARIKRLSGTNAIQGTDGIGDQVFSFSGTIRFVFTGIQAGGIETALLYADYVIGSTQTYQVVSLTAVPADQETVVATPADQAALAGYVTFKTMDGATLIQQLFLSAMAPGDPTTNANGNYLHPTIKDLTDAVPNAAAGWFDQSIVKHGTGMLTDSAWNGLPPLGSDVQSWLNSFNYPYDAQANRMASNGLVIPLGMFREFSLTAPAGDQPTGDTSGLFYPVWVSRVTRLGNTGTKIRFYFATYNVTDLSPVPTGVEFAIMDLSNGMVPGQVVAVVPLDNLQLQGGNDAATWGQHFGRGHVVLSDQWGPAAHAAIQAFFVNINSLPDSAEADFTMSSTRLSSFSLDRMSKYVPTIGESQAMKGTTGRLAAIVNPSDANRFVTEQDQGLGDVVDLEAQPGIVPDPAIERLGNSGSLCHRVVRMIVDPTKMPDGIDNDDYYNSVILPRLTILLGRPPVFGDVWYNGTRFMTMNGSSWQG